MLPNKYSLPADHPFLKKINIKIEPHLSDSGLNVQRLIRLVAMSRTDLHRKISRITGMSTTKYICYLRLIKGADLLLDKKGWSIQQVAFEVGFSNQGYFSRRFKELFHICPREYRQRLDELEHLC